MYSFITNVRYGTISVIPSLRAHAGFGGDWSETKQFECSFVFHFSLYLFLSLYSPRCEKV